MRPQIIIFLISIKWVNGWKYLERIRIGVIYLIYTWLPKPFTIAMKPVNNKLTNKIAPKLNFEFM